ncbi:hypothetical protein IAE22_29075, partial [Bacillus sp. S34]|nr:hypothetical protein [Bacillus sp. S34]
MVAVLGIGLSVVIAGPAQAAPSAPSWDDVRAAKADTAQAQSTVDELSDRLQTLQDAHASGRPVIAPASGGPLDLAPAAVMPTVTAVTATLRRFGITDQDFHVRVDSDVPTARGMGSSAAVAAAGLTLDDIEVFAFHQANL